MSTHDQPILGGIGTVVDTTGTVFQDPLSTQLTLTNSKDTKVLVMQDPNGAGDNFVEGRFNVRQGYVDTPILVIRYIIDGTPASVVAFGFQILAGADSETADAAYGSEQIASNSDWTGYADEDFVEETIALTAGDYAVGDEVFYKFFIDDNVHTFTGNCLITGLFFRYNDA